MSLNKSLPLSAAVSLSDIDPLCKGFFIFTQLRLHAIEYYDYVNKSVPHQHMSTLELQESVSSTEDL